MKTEEINLLYGYPELTEQGVKNTQNIINKFSQQLNEMMNNTIVSFTQNLALEITGDDSWIDLRSQMLNALRGYPHNGDFRLFGYDWVDIRKKILAENREAIINDLLLDKEKEIKHLKDQLEYYQRRQF